jgi:two-component system KDP operon response regulator KdpE
VSQILVVEDEPAIRRFLEVSLLREGHVPALAATLAAALVLLDGRPDDWPELVVLDMTLPDGSGRAVFEAIASRRPGVSFLICTGFTDPRELDGLREAGHRVMSKPFTQDQFLEAIRERLDPDSEEIAPG